MSSIDLYADFNDELDARAGDNDEDDNRAIGDENQAGEGDGEGEEKQEVNANVKAVRIKRKLHTLNVERLKGPRGIIAIDDFFSNIKFKGKGYEKQDLDNIMKRMEHWAHRMYPKYNFDDSLSTIERLGKKRETAMYMNKYRMGELTKDEGQEILEDDENNRNEGDMNIPEDEPMDEFEALIDEQIALSTVHSRTNADKSFGNISSISSSTKVLSATQAPQPSASQTFFQPTQQASQQASQIEDTEPFEPIQPPATQTEITDEVRARIAENKRKAMAILEQRKKEAAEKAKLEKESRYQEITDILFDDTDF